MVIALSITIASFFVHLDLCDGGDFVPCVPTFPMMNASGLVVVIYVYNFIKPLLLAEYWTLKAALSVRFKPENLPCFDDIYINWSPPVSRTWKDIGKILRVAISCMPLLVLVVSIPLLKRSNSYVSLIWFLGHKVLVLLNRRVFFSSKK